MSDLREATLLGVSHPEFIDNGTWQRVDHPVLDPLTTGNADYGWEGDDRLVIYLHLESKTFVLWRLEADGEYRTVAQFSGVIDAENVNRLCQRLVRIDTRRGFDPYADVIAAEDKKAADKDARLREASDAFADKLHFGLARSHMPGVDISRRVFTGFGGT